MMILCYMWVEKHTRQKFWLTLSTINHLKLGRGEEEKEAERIRGREGEAEAVITLIYYETKQ